jgi:thioredoxin
MLEVTDETFEAEVLRSAMPIVVDFWAPWCGPCRATSILLARLEEEYGDRVRFAKLNVDDNAAVASRFSVLSLPTAILFEAGEPRETILGARRRSHYERVWKPWLEARA